MNNEHALRLKSAAVMLFVILIVGLVDNKFITWIFFGVVLYFSVKEANRLFGIEKKHTTIFKSLEKKSRYKNVPSTIIYALILWLGALFIKEPILLIFIALITLASKLAYDKSVNKKEFLPLLYPVASILVIWDLYLKFGMVSLVWLLVIVALSDVGAYYVGKNFGKTPFSPTSPKKTLEGVFGGVIVASIVGAILISSTSDIGFFSALIISFLTSVAGVFGDLFESYLKREAGVKDSSNLIPGHGGVLDRIDGYLFASIMLYILLSIGS